MKVFHPSVENYIGIDFETTGLPKGVQFRQIQGRINVLNPIQGMHPFSDVATTQFATWDSSIDKITHFHVDYRNTQRHSRYIEGSDHKVRIKDPRTGNGIDVDAYRVRQVDPQDILNMLGQSKVKGKKAEALTQAELKKALSKSERMYVYEGNHLSKFALDDIAKTGDGKLEGRIAKEFQMIDFKKLSHRDWSGKGDGSLYKQVDSWLQRATSDRPLVLGAWNPFFDINQMMSDLAKFGYAEKAQELYNAWKMGVIQVDAIEKYWHAIVFRMAKEDAEFAAHFKIGTNLDAALSTGRPGRQFKTFEEFEHSNLWRAEHVGKVLSKHFDVQAQQLHGAGPDVFNEMKVIKQALFDIVQQSGYSFEHLTDVDAAGNLAHILDEGSFTTKLEETFGSDVIRSMKRTISGAQDALRVNRELPSMFESVKMAETAATKLKKWGGIGAAVALAGYLTYGRREDSLFPFSRSTRFKTMGKPQPIRYNTQFESTPNYAAQMAETLGYGILGPAALMYGIGAYSSFSAPQKLGFIPRIPKTIGEIPKHIGDTIYKGIVRTEQKIPISRVFGFSNAIDYFRGSFQHDTINKVTKEDRAFSFYNVKKGRVQEITGTGKNVHGVEFGPLLDAAKGTLPTEEYETLEEMLKPSQRTLERKVSSRQVMVKTVEGKTVITMSDRDAEGARIGREYRQEIPVSVKINKLRGQGQLNRLEYELLQSDAVRRGISPKSNFEEYYDKLEMPEFLKNKPEWQPFYKLAQKAKYKLEIVPKGIGQASNKIYPKMPHYIAGLKYGMHVTGYEGDLAKTAMAQYGYMARIPRNIFVNKMNQFFESPFELLGVPTNTIDKIAGKLSSSNNIIKGIAGKALSVLARPHLGLPAYDMRFGFPQYMMNMGLKRILPAYAAVTAFQGLDHLLGKLTASPGAGPLTMAPIKAFEGMSLLYSKLSDITGFTKIAKKQEKVAPGSTGLGIIAPAMSAVSMFKVGEMLYNGGPSVIKDTLDNVGRKLSRVDIVKRALREEGFRGALERSPLERVMAYAIRNPKKGLFGLMVAPMLPFLPGLVGSNKTYEERKAEFQGKRDVAIRKYRGWLLSPSPYAGGKPIQYRKHFLNLFGSDYENKGVIWPSFGKHFLHNASFGLIGRYALEEYHKEDQPVYESAPYGANIPFIGPVIAATIGKIVKPTVTYHKLQEMSQNIGIAPSYLNGPMENMQTQLAQHPAMAGMMPHNDQRTVVEKIGAQSEGSVSGLYNRWSKQFHDLIGFTGFSYETARSAVTGKKSPDEFTPYAQSASEMYNPAQQMWGWHLGDITGVGGEFLRRIFPYPTKNWKVNDISNELSGVSWIPQGQENDQPDPFKKLRTDLTHGTTFDKTPLGWLYASRKGWEFLYPEVKGKELEQYPDPIRLEVLKSIAPYSSEFTQTAQKVLQMASHNELSPDREQRYYDTLNQVRQLKDQLYANESEFTYDLKTRDVNAIVEQVDDEGAFKIRGDDRKYRLAGVSLSDADIRARLLQNKQFDSAADLQAATEEIKAKTQSALRARIAVGQEVSMTLADNDQITGAKDGIEAIVGNLNEDLNDLGAPFKNTGNLAEHNMQQEKVGTMGKFMARYWNEMTEEDTFWNRKLIPNRDYMHSYLQTQVFNREVKLWSKPIDHFIKPFMASIMHRGIFGLHLDKVPSFTVDRRKKQEYWDILKYIKYKTLAVRAAKDGDQESATYFHNMWRSTMIGANAVSDNQREIIAALPQNERPYFHKFATEADPKKRAEIYKFLPRAAKRIYSAIWTKEMAQQSDDPEIQAQLQNLEETEGWGITPEEEKMYEREAPGVSKADWIRAKYIEEYIKKNPMPSANWSGWSPDINEENVELLALRDQGEQIEDYGFFENKARVAAYDRNAYQAAMTINSAASSSNATINNVLSIVIQDDRVSQIQSMPSQTTNPVVNININDHMSDRHIQSKFLRYADMLVDAARIF